MKQAGRNPPGGGAGGQGKTVLVVLVFSTERFDPARICAIGGGLVVL